jgi:hypothetical protein
MDDAFDPFLGEDVVLLMEYERVFRSQIIAAAITLEAEIDRIIAWHFCPDATKHPLLYSLIFREAEVTYKAKVIILKKLLKLAYPELSAPFAFLPRELLALGELRNKLAHCDIEIPPKAGPPSAIKGVTITSYRDGKRQTQLITPDEVNMKLETCRILRQALALILLIVRDPAKGALEVGAVTKLASFGAPLARKIPKLTSK